MQLVLTVLRYRGAPPEHPLAVRFGEDGGTIGRGHDNTLTLPDRRRWVSTVHAVIEQHGGEFVLIDKSRNGTYINPFLRSSMGKRPKRMEKDSAVVLRQGDEVWIGGFELLVDLSDDDAPLGLQDSVAAEAARAAGAERNLDVPTHFVGVADEDLDLDALVGVAEPAADGDILNVVDGDARAQPPRPEPVTAIFPDPLATLNQAKFGDAAPPPPSPVPETRFEGGAAIPEDYDILADAVVPADQTVVKQPATARPPAASPPATSPPPPAAAAPAPSPQPAAPEPAPPQAPTRRGPDPTDLFLTAVGLDPRAHSFSQRARIMRNAATLLLRLAGGLIQTRVQHDQTRAQLLLPASDPSPANPLSCGFDLENTLRLLLVAEDRGTMSAGEAADDAIAELQRHEAALREAVEASVSDLRRRLDPAVFAAEDRHATVGERLRGSGPEAKAWRRMVAAYEGLSAEIAADPAAALGPAFADAYRRALLRAGQRDPSAR